MLQRTLFFSVPAFLLAANTVAFGQLSIGLNFGADEVNGTSSGTLSPTDMAGVVPQANWNNLNGASGSASSLLANLGGSPIATPITVTWSSPNTWSTTGRGEENNGFPAGGDRTLLTGYIDTGNTAATTASVMISGLDSSFTGPGYDVYVYVLGGVGGRGGAYTIGSTTLFGTAATNPSMHVQDPGVNGTDVGTYLRFTGLTSDSFTLIADASVAGANFRAPIDGIQIVAVPEPAPLALLALGCAGLLVLVRRRRS
jgi:hypothetical protein